MKGLSLAGLPRSGETSRLDSIPRWPNGIKCGPHGGEKRKTKSWTGTDRSLHAGFAAVHHKTIRLFG
jgi:hypothetical protein